MRFATAARWTASQWFLPALFATTCLVAAQNSWRTGYPAGDLASATVGLGIGGPLVAAFVALRFRGFRPLVRTLRSRRSGTVVVLGAWWTLLLGAPLTLCAAVVVSAGSVPDDLASWSVVLVCFATALACALVGLAFTWALPVVVAVPAVALGWFLWLAAAPATGSALLHNLSSTFTGCCSPETRPATVAVLASLAVVGVIGAGVLLLVLPPRWAAAPRLLVAPAVGLILLLGFGAGSLVALSSAGPLQLVPVEPRTTALVCAAPGHLRVCVWPENTERAPALRDLVEQLNLRLGAWGLQAVSAVAEGPASSRAVGVVASEHLSETDLRYSIASGYVDHLVRCPGASGAARDERVALIARGAGLTEPDLEGRVSPAAVPVAAEQAARARSSPAVVRAWFLGGLDAITCDAGR